MLYCVQYQRSTRYLSRTAELRYRRFCLSQNDNRQKHRLLQLLVHVLRSYVVGLGTTGTRHTACARIEWGLSDLSESSRQPLLLLPLVN